MLTRKDKTDYIYQADLQQCKLKDEVYTCPEHILNKPLNNDCFLAHVSNLMDDIETHCTLKKSKPIHTVIQLLDDLLYFDLPTKVKLSQHCSTIKELTVEGQGLIHIPPGCTIRHRLQKFVNKHSNTIRRAQNILKITSQVLTHAQNLDSLWNRAKSGMGVVALSTLIATLMSLLFTQCSTLLTFLGCRKIRKARKKARSSNSGTYISVARSPKPFLPSPTPDLDLQNALESREERNLELETFSPSSHFLASPTMSRKRDTPPPPPPRPESPAMYRNMLALY
jgi:hypothetical protein